jgi:hypothetical protein
VPEEARELLSPLRPGACTLGEVEPIAHDLIAIMDNIPADSFSLDVTLSAS